MLLPKEIREGLSTKLFGMKDIHYLNEIDSTNTRAKELAVKGAPEGTLVVSEKQTKGKGRKGRSWFSPPHEGIYASLILRPTISPREAPRITMLTAVVVAKALLSLTQLKVTIKWPNDILVNGKKLAGILTEIRGETDTIDYIVVGLGLNVNTPRFPDDIRDKATSIFIETGSPFPRARIIREYLYWYEKYYGLFNANGFGPILRLWKRLSRIIGHQIIVDMTDAKYSGEVEDIDENGVLILKDHNGETHRIISGDVILI